MRYRALGNSGIDVPVVSFGAWAIGGWRWAGTDDVAAIRAIQRGIDLGVTCIDTAPIYGMGHSERVVGKAIAGRRDDVIVATKCGVRWDIRHGYFVFASQMSDGTPCEIRRFLGPESIKRECEESLERLGLDVIDLYQCHQPDYTTPAEDAMAAMIELQDEGKIRAIGVSNFTVDMLEACVKTGRLASDQPLYNSLERGIESDVLPYCRAHNVAVLAYSPLAQGLMTGKVTMERVIPERDGRRDKPWFQAQNRRRVLDMLARIQPIADGYGATLGQIAIAWVLAQPGITSALVGARNEAQVEENAKGGDIALSDEEVRVIRDEVEALGAAV